MDHFIVWLEEQLQERGWTQAEFARRTRRISKAQVSRVLGGIQQPGRDFLEGTANALGESRYTILREAGLLPPEPEPTAGLHEAIELLGQLNEEERGTAIAVVRAILERGGDRPE